MSLPSGASAFGFNESDLLLNRHGALSPRQRVQLRREKMQRWRMRQRMVIVVLATLILIGGRVLINEGPKLEIGLLVMLAIAILHQLIIWRTQAEIEFPDEVRTIEGSVQIRIGPLHQGCRHYLQIRCLSFRLDEVQAHFFMAGHLYRLHYLDHPLRLLSFEEVEKEELHLELMDLIRLANWRLRTSLNFKASHLITNRLLRLHVDQSLRIWRRFWDQKLDGVTASHVGLVAVLITALMVWRGVLLALGVAGWIGLMVGLWHMPAWRRLMRDLRLGNLRVTEGYAIEITTRHGTHLSVGGKVFATNQSPTRLFDPVLFYRVYYLPISRIIVSAEAGIAVATETDADDTTSSSHLTFL